jgi:hypothetical protein
MSPAARRSRKIKPALRHPCASEHQELACEVLGSRNVTEAQRGTLYACGAMNSARTPIVLGCSHSHRW